MIEQFNITKTIILDAISFVRQGWCQGDMAIDKEGKHCSVESNRAQQWCAVGAIKRAIKEHGEESCSVENLLDNVCKEFVDKNRIPIDVMFFDGYQPIITCWNDMSGRTVDDVVYAMERVVE